MPEEIIHKVPDRWLFLLRDMFIQFKQAEYHYNVVKAMVEQKVRHCALAEGALPDSSLDFDIHAGTILERRKGGLDISGAKEGV